MKGLLWGCKSLNRCLMSIFRGSGCGCGGGGGCGRKKREVLGQQIRTETDSPCPQSEWKILIEEVSSKRLIKCHNFIGQYYFLIEKSYVSKILIFIKNLRFLPQNAIF